MGLEKTKINDQGISVSYWRIDYVTIGHREKRATMCLLGYIDKTKRDQGLNPILSEVYHIWSDTYDATFGPDALDAIGNPMHAAYQWIKANTEFSDAVDA